MPRNPHPPRGGPKKKPQAGQQDADDTSFIVFTNAKDEPKKGKKGNREVKPGQEEQGKPGASSSKAGSASGKAGPAPGQNGDPPKRPDTRTLIGGASWTGKLPVNMLSEHCQKQKWDKPEYTMAKTREGFVSTVVLGSINPKTREAIALPAMRLPDGHKHLAFQPTAVEARHFAAAYALFRVCNMKNIHMMMPPTYRDLWKGEFQEIKKEAEVEGNGWMYAADPFMAHREREEAKAIAAKKREEREKQKAREQSKPRIGPGASGDRMKGWTRVPRIEMGKRTRAEVERLIRRDVLWNPHGTRIPAAVKTGVIDEIAALGFRRSHVEEAAGICKDREEILEWLLIHVPEDDLPPWSLPEGYTAGLSMASGNLQREASLKRLAAGGYAVELCEDALDSQNGDEQKAAAVLQAQLLRRDDTITDPSHDLAHQAVGDSSAAVNTWNEEQDVLSSIYDRRYKSNSPDSCSIRLEIAGSGKTFNLLLRRPFGPYPHVLPVIAVQADIPAYIRLSVVKQGLAYALSNLLGDQMIFGLVDWLEQEIPNIMENPGQLTEVSPALYAADFGRNSKQIQESAYRRKRPRPIKWVVATSISNHMLTDWQAKQNTPAQKKMVAARQSLPAWKLQEQIVNTVNEHQVTIISGETGSGKSTQSVQFILDDLIKRRLGEAANIICTQPRRISALGLADRVAEERCSTVGEEIGYAIRGESKLQPGRTKITFVTTGVLLRRLQTSGGRREDVATSLADVSHVVVDEVHERSLDTDFLLILLRDVLRKRKDLKVVLMSATLDANIFEAYFRDVGPVGRIEIQGRTYPVHDLFVDDVIRITGFQGQKNDDDDQESSPASSMGKAVRGLGTRINYGFIAQLVKHIDNELGDREGGILVFLPGTMEIDRTLQALRAIPNIHALPLHASLLPAEQRRVFSLAPRGKRKVVASTNVAETSITIEDIVAVIDTGRVKETSFDPQNNMVRLEEVWASRAACKQRRGRAGRVRAGTCYKLYTRRTELERMAERPDPEIRRVPLEQLCLSVKAMGIRDVSAFLAGTLTPPDSLAVEGALAMLARMGATDGEEMTALGRHLAMIPADLRCSKLLVYGATFGCLDAALTIASILTARSPFFSPQTAREESKAVRSSLGKGHGDLIADLRAYECWSTMRKSGTSNFELRTWCNTNFLSSQTLFDISSNRSTYLSALKETGFIPVTYSPDNPSHGKSHNAQNENDALLRALIAGAFNPQIARIVFPDKKFAASVSGAVELDPEAKTIKYFTQENGRVFVHPGSTLFDAQGFPGNSCFLSYFGKMETSKVFVRELTPFNAYTLLLFSGAITLDTLGRGLVVDGWLRLRGWARIGVLVSRLRLMLDEVLARKIEDPGLDLAACDVVAVVRKLVEIDGLDR